MIRFLLILGLALTCYPATVHAQPVEPSSIRVEVDHVPVEFDVSPIIEAGRTLAPFRAIAEALGVVVTWEAASQTVHATSGAVTIRLPIGQRTAYRLDQPIALDVPAQIREGRTLVPLRFFAEAFGAKVEWLAADRLVRIQSPPRPMTVIGFYALGSSEASSWTDLFGVPYPDHTHGKTEHVTDLALGWYSLDAQGRLLTDSVYGWRRPDGWEDVLAVAQQYGLRTQMTIHATDADGRLTQLLADEAAQARAVEGILEHVDQYDGVNLDLEGLGLTQQGDALEAVRDSFTAFVRKLAERLPQNKTLTLTLHAPNSQYRGYDYAALATLADRIIVMAYNYGPVPEPLDRVIEAVRLALDAVPADKLVLGISLPHETETSLPAKIGLAKRYGLQGIALWRLGLVPDNFWATIGQMINAR